MMNNCCQHGGGLFTRGECSSPPRLFLYCDMKCETAWADTHTDTNAAQLLELKIICMWERLAEKKLFLRLSAQVGILNKSSRAATDDAKWLREFYFGLKPLKCTPAAVGNERGHTCGSTWTFPTRLTVLLRLVRQKPATPPAPTFTTLTNFCSEDSEDTKATVREQHLR